MFKSNIRLVVAIAVWIGIAYYYARLESRVYEISEKEFFPGMAFAELAAQVSAASSKADAESSSLSAFLMPLLGGRVVSKWYVAQWTTDPKAPPLIDFVVKNCFKSMAGDFPMRNMMFKFAKDLPSLEVGDTVGDAGFVVIHKSPTEIIMRHESVLLEVYAGFTLHRIDETPFYHMSWVGCGTIVREKSIFARLVWPAYNLLMRHMLKNGLLLSKIEMGHDITDVMGNVVVHVNNDKDKLATPTPTPSN